MRVAIIGGGISGLAAASELDPAHDVTVIERGAALGGHTYTFDASVGGRTHAVDMGFIVFNRHNYPGFTAMLDALGVDSQPTEMSFSVSALHDDVEYNASRLSTLFAQRRNVLRPRFLRMLRDILRFYREAPALLDAEDGAVTIEDYLRAGGYSREFAEWHLLPMAQALWSAPRGHAARFPACHLVRFLHNHRMLQLDGRPEWRVVRGGSARYVEAWRRAFRGRVELGAGVRRVVRTGTGVEVVGTRGPRRFDRVVLACHSDQALALLDAPSRRERQVLGAIRYQPNTVDLHCDDRLLPRRRRCWAAWNVVVPERERGAVSVTYNMNILQRLQTRLPLLVTLNRRDDIDPGRLLHSTEMSHPVYDASALQAQTRWAEIDGAGGIHYAGAYWGFGFHEDGVQSGRRAALRVLHRARAAA